MVDEVNGGKLFYYFIESEGNPSEDPLVLWLTGGNRCSALSGLIFEIGTMRFKYFDFMTVQVFFAFLKSPAKLRL
jgi:carboxypeptidase C (cathepsin A)